MSFSFLPRIIFKSLTDIQPAFLERRGIRLLMLDFDNTILPYTTNEPTAQTAQWLEDLCASKITVCVVSNSKKARVREFCRKMDIPCFTHARKPFSKGIRRCMQSYSLPKSACALVGDQIYTDVLGANCAGITSILVQPICLHNIWLKLRHVAEKPFIFLARNRRIEP